MRRGEAGIRIGSVKGSRDRGQRSGKRFFLGGHAGAVDRHVDRRRPEMGHRSYRQPG